MLKFSLKHLNKVNVEHWLLWVMNCLNRVVVLTFGDGVYF
jgi:hypothetical protein